MDVRTIAAKYGGLPMRLISRAEENWRLTSAKKSAGLDPFAGPVACIIVAARAMEEPVDKKRLAKCAGANTRLIEPMVRKVLDAVGVRTVVKISPSALCIKFGCEALTEIVHRVLDEYRVYLAQMAAANRRKRRKHSVSVLASTMNENDPVFAAACLYAVSKQAKINVNQERLLEAVCGDSKAFDAIVSSVETQCQMSLSGAILDRKKLRSFEVKRAAKKLREQYRIEQLEDEERRRTSPEVNMASSHLTLVQQHRLQSLHTSRGNKVIVKSLESSENTATAATPEEYAEWRAMALEFMRSKKQKELAKSSDS
ncbi:atorc6 orc6 [Plasmopara halstedii]|uniref:Atorc6 orc6 n=1 Tax=Plasmopara halstedii TaxID=4781 RepID=A0A0P1ACV5_PLAHL|nr:atorc6 orc6 [Plasmopara halstedii]CEG38826.1 atorc6 orc6 [Plasmopara halstedii]|eukprot:XP_024575195.1 atorc6 orc6 [Plasmopara halstedii]